MEKIAILAFLKSMSLDMILGLLKKSAYDANKKISGHKQYYKTIENAAKYLTCESQSCEGETEDLRVVLSEEHLSLLAEELKGCSGYEFREKLTAHVEKLLEEAEIPRELKAAYVEWFCGSVIMQLRDIDPEKYDRSYLEDWRKEQELRESRIIRKLDALQIEFSLFDRENIEIDTADSLDAKLKKMTVNPSIGIDFFAVDDDEFKSHFSEKRSEECVYVQGRNREETIYSIINELWALNDPRPIYVVKNKEAWGWLEKRETRGNIYIPWFYLDEIQALPGNTNIFVYTYDMVNPSGGTIRLRPRTRGFLTKCFEKTGMDYAEVSQMMNDTHGLFIPLKKRIFNGAYYKAPDWLGKLPLHIQQTCLLIGQWSDLDGDRTCIESLSGMKYQSFIETLRPFMVSEEPLIYHVRLHGLEYYSLAVPEEAWDYIPVSVKDNIWKKYYLMIKNIIMNAEKIFSYSSVDKLAAQLRGEKAYYSGLIREGMLRTLIMKLLYKSNENIQTELDLFTEMVLHNTKTEDQWKYLTDYFSLLCEISPKSVIGGMQEELANPSGPLCSLLRNPQKPFELDKNYIFPIISGLETLLCQRRYAADAFRIIARISSLSSSEKENAAVSIMEMVLFPLSNWTAIRTPEEKGNAAESAVRLAPQAWNTLLRTITQQHFIFAPISRPRYRESCDEERVSSKDAYATYCRFLEILLKHTEFRPERWEQLFEHAGTLEPAFIQKAIDQFKYEATQMSDREILQVKRSIQGTVFSERYMRKELNEAQNNRLCLMEKLLEELHTKTPEYDYALFFVAKGMLPLIHPVSIHENNTRERNEEKSLKLLKHELDCFQKKRLDLGLLSSICSDYPENRLGIYLGRLWNGGVFDISVFKVLAAQSKTEKIALDYFMNSPTRKAIVFDNILKAASELGCSEKIIVGLYRGQMYDAAGVPEINNAHENIKKLFWTERCFPYEGDTAWALDQCRQYGTLETYLDLLEGINIRNPFKAAELLYHLSFLSGLPIGEGYNNITYCLHELLAPVQKAYISDAEKRKTVAGIEIAMFPFLQGEDLRCLRAELTNDPQLYAELVSILYKKDSPDSEQGPEVHMNQNLLHNLRSLYQLLEFCPGEENGIVKEEKLRKWVERFSLLLEKSNQSSLLGMLLGRLFAMSPKGEDGSFPCEAVRIVFEEYADSAMVSEFECTVYNSRGVFWDTEGREEKKIAKTYRETADNYSCVYPRLADAFYSLAEQYEAMAKEERIEAENRWH